MGMCYDGALVMPSSYALMDEEEMMYLEGGKEKKVHWWGVSLKLTGKETAQLLSDASWGAVAFCGVLGLASGAAAAAYGVAIGVYGYTISRMNRNNSGVTLKWTWLDMVNGLPSEVVDNY